MRKPELEAQRLLDEAGISEIPVPVERLVRWSGADLSFERLPSDVSGMLVRDDSRRVVAVNAGHARTRQRFTMAHELGHLHLHRGVFVDTVRINLRDELAHQGTDPQEIDANAFAAEILMPRRHVIAFARDLIGRGAFTEADLVEPLAKRFDVSAQAMSIRVVVLGIGLPT